MTETKPAPDDGICCCERPDCRRTLLYEPWRDGVYCAADHRQTHPSLQRPREEYPLDRGDA